jgi:hypothetical protein
MKNKQEVIKIIQEIPLKEDSKRKAINGLNSKHWFWDDMSEDETADIDINGRADWEKTKEGSDFWKSISNSLQKFYSKGA